MSKRCPCCGKKMQHAEISGEEVVQCPRCGYVEEVGVGEGREQNARPYAAPEHTTETLLLEA